MIVDAGAVRYFCREVWGSDAGIARVIGGDDDFFNVQQGNPIFLDQCLDRKLLILDLRSPGLWTWLLQLCTSLDELYLVVGIASVAVYLLQASFLSANRMSASERVKKSIPKTSSMLVLANKVYSQN